MSDRSHRLDIRVTATEQTAYRWGAAQDGAGSVGAWLRQLGNQRVRKIRGPGAHRLFTKAKQPADTVGQVERRKR